MFVPVPSKTSVKGSQREGTSLSIEDMHDFEGSSTCSWMSFPW